MGIELINPSPAVIAECNRKADGELPAAWSTVHPAYSGIYWVYGELHERRVKYLELAQVRPSDYDPRKLVVDLFGSDQCKDLSEFEGCFFSGQVCAPSTEGLA